MVNVADFVEQLSNLQLRARLEVESEIDRGTGR
jgi:hypothetical protein